MGLLKSLKKSMGKGSSKKNLGLAADAAAAAEDQRQPDAVVADEDGAARPIEVTDDELDAPIYENVDEAAPIAAKQQQQQQQEEEEGQEEEQQQEEQQGPEPVEEKRKRRGLLKALKHKLNKSRKPKKPKIPLEESNKEPAAAGAAAPTAASKRSSLDISHLVPHESQLRLADAGKTTNGPVPHPPRPQAPPPPIPRPQILLTKDEDLSSKANESLALVLAAGVRCESNPSDENIAAVRQFFSELEATAGVPKDRLKSVALRVSGSIGLEAYLRLLPSEPVQLLGGHQGLVTSLLRVNSLLLSGSGDTSVRVHDLHGAEKTQAWHQHEKPRGCVNAIVAVRPSTLVPTKDDGAAETSTGFIATAGADCNIVLSSNGTRLRQSEPAQRHKDTVRALAYLPARELLASGSLDGTVKIWDLELQCIETLQLGEPVVALAAVGEQLLLVAAGTALTLYDLSDGAPRAVGSAIHTAPVQALAVSGDRIYAGDRDGDISSWSTSLELLATRRAHARGVTSLNAELAGALLSTSTDGAVVISDARGLGELRTLRTSSPCYSLAVADGCIMAGLSSKKIAVF